MKNLKEYKHHLFPLGLVLVVFILTLLKLSGTSIGVYNEKFYGENSHDSNLVTGHPQDVRSDEFLVITQLTIIQANNHFSKFNPYQNGGKDVSVLLDVPYLEWSTVFKPQNFPFYVMPLENAFALKWWGMLVALLISSYYFFLRLVSKNRILIAVAGSILIAFSPFVFWWYQAGTIMTLAYGFILMIISISIIDQLQRRASHEKHSIIKLLLKCILLAYILVCFALNIYPPFQIPIALVTAAYVAGYLLNTTKFNVKRILIFITPFVVTAIVSVIVLLVFIMTRQSTFDSIANTVYPGKRIVPSGQGYYPPHLVTSYLQPQLQRDSRGPGYIINQSESSNFIVTSVLTLVPSIYLLYKGYRRRKYDMILVTTSLLNIIFLSHILLPLPHIFTKLTLLSSVPQQRLIIGMGMLGVVQLIHIASIMLKSKSSIFTKRFVVFFVGCLTLVGLIAGLITAHDYPKFVSQPWLIASLLAFYSIGILLFFSNKLKAGLLILAAMSIGSVVAIHPLYKGLSPIYRNEISKSISDISPSNSTWGVVDGTLINNLPQIAKRNTISGIEYYPNTSYWSKKVGSAYNSTYNRYAHVTLSDHPYDIILMQSDLFMVSIRCDKAVTKDLDFILSTKTLSQPCLQFIKSINYPAAQYYIYKVRL